MMQIPFLFGLGNGLNDTKNEVLGKEKYKQNSKKKQQQNITYKGEGKQWLSCGRKWCEGNCFYIASL